MRSEENNGVTRTQELSKTSTSAEEEAGRGIEIGTELCERSNFTVLSEVELERTSELLHDLARIPNWSRRQ